MQEQEIELLEEFKRLGLSLGRTGRTLMALATIAIFANAIDFTGHRIVTALTLGFILLCGYFLYLRAGAMLRTLDRGVIELLRTRRGTR